MVAAPESRPIGRAKFDAALDQTLAEVGTTREDFVTQGLSGTLGTETLRSFWLIVGPVFTK